MASSIVLILSVSISRSAAYPAQEACVELWLVRELFHIEVTLGFKALNPLQDAA